MISICQLSQFSLTMRESRNCTVLGRFKGLDSWSLGAEENPLQQDGISFLRASKHQVLLCDTPISSQ